MKAALQISLYKSLFIHGLNNEYILIAKRNFRLLFFPFIWIRKIFYKTGLEKCLEFREEKLSDYLGTGLDINNNQIQSVINRIKRDYGYRPTSISAEEDYRVKRQSFVTVKHAVKYKVSVAIAYHTIVNNEFLWNKYMK